MVRCEDGSHYTGITTDPRRRMREHVLRLSPGAKYTKSHRVIALDALWSAQTEAKRAVWKPPSSACTQSKKGL